MRLATIAFTTGISGAVVRDGHAAPVSSYPDVGAILAAGEAGIAAASAAADADCWQPFGTEDLRLPVTSPSAVFCVGLNYRAHIVEMGREPPEHPTLFAKQPRALTDPFAPVQLPRASAQVDYEGELVVVIGRAGRDIPAEIAPIHIGGYCLMNDVTMRDWQYRTAPVVRRQELRTGHSGGAIRRHAGRVLARSGDDRGDGERRAPPAGTACRSHLRGITACRRHLADNDAPTG